jgi:hypothetical protein
LGEEETTQERTLESLVKRASKPNKKITTASTLLSVHSLLSNVFGSKEGETFISLQEIVEGRDRDPIPSPSEEKALSSVPEFHQAILISCSCRRVSVALASENMD